MSADVQERTDLVNIEVDGRVLQARKGAMLIEATDDAGIHVPRFCYHRKLSIAANCRMCLVEVEKAPKPMPACSTPVMEGMKVYTRSERALRAQKGVMEFLLINHPLDCPICDQGGECELQDLAMGYGRGVSRFSERKRVVEDEHLGPLIATEMTRCIHCTRCVRFLDEIAGQPELGGMGRGEHTEISTWIGAGVNSELSGNIIDLCPVGALTSRPYRFTARAWELLSHPSVSPHDCVGSTLRLHHVNGKVKRVVPLDNDGINECWIADRDRFGYEGLHREDARLHQPMIREDGVWRVVGWEVALAAAAGALRRVVDQHGGEALGALVSPTATLEEMYLLRRVLDGLGCANIDARLRQGDFSDDGGAGARAPVSEVTLAGIERLRRILIVGGNPRHEQPMLNHRIRKAALAGAEVRVLNPAELDLNYPVAEQLLVSMQELPAVLAGVACACLAAQAQAVPTWLTDLAGQVERGGEVVTELVAMLRGGGETGIHVGALVVSDPRGALLRQLIALIAANTGAARILVSDGPNTVGAYAAGAVPFAGDGSKTGLDAHAMIAARRRGYVLFGLDPAHDVWDPVAGAAALAQADAVVAFSAFRSPALDSLASVLLPIGAWSETSGTYVSMEGRWQEYPGIAAPPGEARPGWRVLRVLGNQLGLAGFEYEDRAEVSAELAPRRPMTVAAPPAAPADLLAAPPAALLPELGDAARAPAATGLQRIDTTPRAPERSVWRIGMPLIYGGDALVRHAPALQATPLATAAAGAWIGKATAHELGVLDGDAVDLEQGECRLRLTVRVGAIAPGVMYLPSGIEASAALGPMVGPVRLRRVQ
jgi:NADH-quinone oxidoreductase subunit G